MLKDFRKDHRIFMMSCIAALVFGGNWKIHNKDSVNSSFPNFFKILKYLRKNKIEKKKRYNYCCN